MTPPVKPEPAQDDDPYLAKLDSLAAKTTTSDQEPKEEDDPYLAKLDSMNAAAKKQAAKKPEPQDVQVPGAQAPQQGWFEKWGSPDAPLAERAAHGLIQSVPGTVESIAHLVSGYIKPSLEELRDSRKSALGRLNLFGHVATDQQIHDAIIRRATQQEVTTADVEKQGAYFIPGVGQGLLGLDVIEALMDAKTSGDKAETIGNFLGSLVFFSAVHKVIVGRTLKGIEARGKEQASKAAQARVLAGNGENADAVKDIPIRDVPSVVESEQAAIKARLLDEEDGNIIATVMRAHRELNSDGTTVIPDVPRAHSLVDKLADKFGNTPVALHDNGDGTHDIALVGDKSVLRNAEEFDQFEKEGYYKGQEVSYNGKPVVYNGDRLMKQVKVTDLDGNEFYADPARIRRPGYTKSATLITHLAEERDVPLEEVAMGDPRESRTTGKVARLVGPAYRVGERLFVGPRYDIAKKLATDALRSKEDEMLRKVTSGKALPAVRDDEGNIHYRKSPAEHGDLLANARDEGATFDKPGSGGGWIVDNKFVHQSEVTPSQEGELGALNTENKFIKQEDLPAYFKEYGPLGLQDAAKQVPKVGPMKIPMGELINGKLRQPAPPVDLLRYRAGVVEIDPDAVYEDYKGFSSDRLRANEPFDKVIADYALERGLNDKLDGLKRYIAFKQAQDLREMYLSDSEKELFKQAKEDGMKESGMIDGRGQNLIGMLRLDHDIPLSLQAYTNGMYLDVAPNGSYLIRDIRTGDLLGRFHTADAARDFIKHSGQAGGEDLDGGGGNNPIPPDAVAGGTQKPPVPPPPPNKPLDGFGGTKSDPVSGIKFTLDYLQHKVRGVPLRILQNYREKAIFADKQASLLGIRTNFTEWADQAVRAVNRRDNRVGPFIKELNDIGQDAMRHSQNKDDYDIAGRYLETATTDELAQHMHPDAVKYGEDLASKNIDVHKAIAFSRQLMDLKKLFSDPKEWENAGNQLATSQNVSSEQLWAARLFNIIRERDINVVPVHDVARYAETKIMENNGVDMSRDGFAKANGLKPYQIVMANRMESFFKKVADALDIPDYRRIFRYLAHYRTEKTGEFYDAFLKQKGIESDATATFISEMVRTGEIDAYDLNPLSVGLRYVTGILNAREIAPVHNKIKSQIEYDIQQLAGHETGKTYADELHNTFYDGMLGDMRGFPEATNKFTAGVIKEMSDNLKLNLPRNITGTLANLIMAFYSNMYIAFRPAKGLQHLNTVMDNYFGRFGLERTANMMKELANPDAVKAAKEYGALGVFNPYTVGTPLENAATAFSRGLNYIPHVINKISEFGLQGSGLKKVYEWTKGATFMEARNNALSHLTKLAFGEQSLDATLKGIGYDAFEDPFKNRIQDVLASNDTEKYLKAANMIGQETSEMIVASYGNMYRVGGWRNIPGRMFGQFGVYPIWNANQTLSQIGRGPLAYRAAVMARRALYNGLIMKAGDATGVNVNNFLMWHSLNWAGGPALGDHRKTLGNLWNLMHSVFTDDQDAAMTTIKRMGTPAFIQDWSKATDMDDYWYLNPVQRAAQAIGIPSQPPQ